MKKNGSLTEERVTILLEKLNDGLGGIELAILIIQLKNAKVLTEEHVDEILAKLKNE